MKCKMKRTFMNILKINNCFNCINYCSDEYIAIANTKVNIYYLASRCLLISYDDIFIAFNKKIKLFLKDAIINRDTVLPLWITKDELLYIKNNSLYNLVELSLNIHIAIL